jgi:hexosaminidase
MFALLVSPFAGAAPAKPPQEPAVIPRPASLVPMQGRFMLDAATPLFIPQGDEEARAAATRLADLLAHTHALKLEVREGKPGNGIVFARDATLAPEAYRLEVGPRRITLSAATSTGLLYGSTTLWQLVPPASGDTRLALPAMRIADAPRFAWRGIMLDSARHFQSPQFVHSFLEWMALHKLNVFHWHLTDDQGWRIEIKKYPRLTEVGAWRIPATAPTPSADASEAPKPPRYGGFYTQDQVREIVAHATRLGIAVVPEIEMPGHASAAVVAYPQLGAAPPLPAVPADWGIFENVYNPTEYTFGFLEDVLTEVLALFPGRYIHVGGDEVAKTQWKSSPEAQARMRELGLSDVAELQNYFTQRIARFLEQHGRRLVGWDEILTPGMPASAVVMSWRGIDGAVAATAKNHDAVLSPWPTLYFDNRQGDGNDEPPGRTRTISLEDVYRFEPVGPGMTQAAQSHVLGLQGNVWTEHIRTEERVGLMTFPRAAAIAETGWTPPRRREWKDFVRRMAVQFARYDALGLPYSDTLFAPRARVTYDTNLTQATVTFYNQAGYGDFRYTLDGKAPRPDSPRERATVATLPRDLWVATFSGANQISRVHAVQLGRYFAQYRSSRELKLCSENIALDLEDDAPLEGWRAIFSMDILNPCWIFPQADLDGSEGIQVAVGQVPFNFQVGDEIKKLHFPKPWKEGELEVHLDSCDGDVIARLPLGPALKESSLTQLSPMRLQGVKGRHDLCLRFAQAFANPATDPIWALYRVQIIRPDLTDPLHKPWKPQ